MAYSAEYQAWRNMKARCRNPKHHAFARYGGRGINYDPQWEQFGAFLADMGLKPSRGLSLERLDNDRGYYRENCAWATSRAQARNRSGTLSQVKARNIRRMHATGHYRPHELMQRFDVTWQSIKNVITRRTWY